MNYEIWHNISVSFFIAGILFTLAALFFSVKFQLFSVIKSEITTRSEKNHGDELDYIYNAVKDTENKEEETKEKTSVGNTYSFEDETVGDTSYTVLAPREQAVKGTVIVPRDDDINEKNSNNSEFVIKENIIVINGNPSVIKII